MSPDLLGVLKGAQLEMEDLLHQIRTCGARYARDYASALLDGTESPRRPREIPRGVAVEIEAIVENECQLPRRIAA